MGRGEQSPYPCLWYIRVTYDEVGPLHSPMYSSYVTRTGLHKILPFHAILFGRISYCSAFYFDTARRRPVERLHAEYRMPRIYSAKQSGIRFYRARRNVRTRDTDNRVSFTGNAFSRISLLSFQFSRHWLGRAGPVSLNGRGNDIFPGRRGWKSLCRGLFCDSVANNGDGFEIANWNECRRRRNILWEVTGRRFYIGREVDKVLGWLWIKLNLVCGKDCLMVGLRVVLNPYGNKQNFRKWFV